MDPLDNLSVAEFQGFKEFQINMDYNTVLQTCQPMEFEGLGVNLESQESKVNLECQELAIQLIQHIDQLLQQNREQQKEFDTL